MNRLLLLLLLLPTIAWSAVRQSALHPAGPAAETIADITLIMTVGGSLIFVGVMSLLLYGLLARQPRPAWRGEWMIIGGGIVFPAVVILALLIYTTRAGARISAAPPPNTLTVDITGMMWWWDVRYQGLGDEPALVTANELRIPVGRPVHVRVRSNDVIHSFWIPNLAGKIDMIPGRTNRITLQANVPGVYRGACAEFCGAQHTQMALHVVAEEPEVWEQWFSQRRSGARLTLTDTQQRGQQVFMDAGCGSCHAIRGVSDPPPGIAPDLTHVGSRPSLAAGLLPNNVGNLAGWIAGSQRLKPGNRMPSYTALDGPSLTALADYLSSLE